MFTLWHSELAYLDRVDLSCTGYFPTAAILLIKAWLWLTVPILYSHFSFGWISPQVLYFFLNSFVRDVNTLVPVVIWWKASRFIGNILQTVRTASTRGCHVIFINSKWWTLDCLICTCAYVMWSNFQEFRWCHILIRLSDWLH